MLLKGRLVGVVHLSQFLKREKVVLLRCQPLSSSSSPPPPPPPPPYRKPVGNKSYLSVPGRVPLLEATVGEVLDQSAKLFPDSPAIVVCSSPNQSQRNYEGFKKDVDNFAAGLLKIGLGKGDRIGIWGPNSYEWYLTFWAAIKCGLILVNINPAYTTRELSYCLNKVGIKAMVIAEPFKTSNYHSMLLETCPEVETSDPGRILARNAPTLKTIITMSPLSTKGAFTMEQVIHQGSNPESLTALTKTEKLVQFDDVCNVQFTSGTTGNPKGVMLSHHNIVNNGYQISQRLGYTQKDKICLSAPFFHCFGCVIGGMAAVHAGAAMVLPSPGFSALHALQAIHKERCTAMYGTPTMHIDILHSPDFSNHDVSSLRVAVTGGTPTPERLIGLMKEKYGIENITIVYGLTEVSPVAFQTFDTDSDATRVGTVGYPMDHLEVKVVDSEGKTVELGQQGEMCIRGYSVMLGYWDEPDKTAQSIDQARWFHSGDLAVLLESGYGRIVGRSTDMIIRGGENIYPREIENFLHTHPSIQEGHVFGVPDFRMGEEVAVWLKLKSGSPPLSIEELRGFCKGKIAHYKIPRYIKLVNEFPTTTSGKIQKFKMREAMSQELGLKEE